MAKYTEFCNEVIKNVGGKENISCVVHCMTRLRLNVKDKSKVNVEAVKEVKVQLEHNSLGNSSKL